MEYHYFAGKMIKVTALSKRFKLYRTPADRLKEIVLRKTYHTDFQALNNISFEVADGETLGIIGQNGAGKSTLLKILSGVILPDSGAIVSAGKITGLLELGTGFNAEMTGVQNIYMNGLLLGMDRNEVDAKRDTIIDFAELGEFIYEPIKTYSSGMVMRLAFSIAMHADPKCFLVDEALSVGDAYFQHKCIRKIIEFKNQGGSIIFVSHDPNAVKTLCDVVLLLDHGRMIDYGEPAVVVDFFLNMMLKKMHQGDQEVKVTRSQKPLKQGEDASYIGNRDASSTGEVELRSCKIYNERDEEIAYIVSEHIVKIVYEIQTFKDLQEPHYGIMIRNKLGLSVFETNTYCMRLYPEAIKKGQTVKVMYEFFCNLAPATYSISIGVAQKGFSQGAFEEYLLLTHDVEILKVIENDHSIVYSGIFNINPVVTIESCSQ